MRNKSVKFIGSKTGLPMKLTFNPPIGWEDKIREDYSYGFCFFKNWWRGNFRIAGGEVAFFYDEIEKI